MQENGPFVHHVLVRLRVQKTACTFFQAFLDLFVALGTQLVFLFSLFCLLAKSAVFVPGPFFCLPEILLLVLALVSLGYGTWKAVKMPSLLQVAHEVDRRENWEDLVSTAFSFLSKAVPPASAQIVIHSAAQKLRTLNRGNYYKARRKGALMVFPVVISFLIWNSIFSTLCFPENDFLLPNGQTSLSGHSLKRPDGKDSPLDTSPHSPGRSAPKKTPGDKKSPEQEKEGREGKEGKEGEQGREGQDGPQGKLSKPEGTTLQDAAEKIEKNGALKNTSSDPSWSDKKEPEQKPGKSKGPVPDAGKEREGKANGPKPDSSREKKEAAGEKMARPSGEKNRNPGQDRPGAGGEKNDPKKEPRYLPFGIKPLFGEGDRSWQERSAYLYTSDPHGKPAPFDLEEYHQFARQSEEYLEKTNLPPAHRESIRHYFRLIRPHSATREK